MTEARPNVLSADLQNHIDVQFTALHVASKQSSSMIIESRLLIETASAMSHSKPYSLTCGIGRINHDWW